MSGPLVLIIAASTDLCARLTRSALHQRGARVITFEAGDLPATVGLQWSVDPPDGQSCVEVDSTPVPLDAIAGVLARLQPQPPPDPHSTSDEQQYISGEMHAALFAFLHSLDCRVINRPEPGVAHR